MPKLTTKITSYTVLHRQDEVKHDPEGYTSWVLVTKRLFSSLVVSCLVLTYYILLAFIQVLPCSEHRWIPSCKSKSNKSKDNARQNNDKTRQGKARQDNISQEKPRQGKR
jgi:hypothetical protein